MRKMYPKESPKGGGVMKTFFDARITYSAKWSDTGEEWSQVEGFQNEDFLNSFLKAMDWRIVKHEILN